MDFVASADEWFGPVQAKLGPDGSPGYWLVFHYQHNPTPEGWKTAGQCAYQRPARFGKEIYTVRYKSKTTTSLVKMIPEGFDSRSAIPTCSMSIDCWLIRKRSVRSWASAKQINQIISFHFMDNYGLNAVTERKQVLDAVRGA